MLTRVLQPKNALLPPIASSFLNKKRHFADFGEELFLFVIHTPSSCDESLVMCLGRFEFQVM